MARAHAYGSKCGRGVQRTRGGRYHGFRLTSNMTAGLNRFLFIPEEFLTLKSFQKNRVSMMGRSEVILTIYATIHNERV